MKKVKLIIAALIASIAFSGMTALTYATHEEHAYKDRYYDEAGNYIDRSPAKYDKNHCSYDDHKSFDELHPDYNMKNDNAYKHVHTDLFKADDPIFKKAKDCDFDAVKEYIKKGGDINAVDYKGDTLLHIAVAEKCYDLIDLLLDQRAILPFKYDKSGKPPMFNALDYHNDDHDFQIIVHKFDGLGRGVHEEDKYGCTLMARLHVDKLDHAMEEKLYDQHIQGNIDKHQR